MLSMGEYLAVYKTLMHLDASPCVYPNNPHEEPTDEHHNHPLEKRTMSYSVLLIDGSV